MHGILKDVKVVRVENGTTIMKGKDGLQVQVEILDELSKRLDQDFAMRDIGIPLESNR